MNSAVTVQWMKKESLRTILEMDRAGLEGNRVTPRIGRRDGMSSSGDDRPELSL
jgi:hypothetical protein